MNLWIFIFFLPWIYSQECSKLDSNTICGLEFDGFPIFDKSFETDDPSILKSFNDSLSDYLDLDKVSLEFSKDFECNQEELDFGLESLRFQTSFFCAQSLYDAQSKGCSKESQIPLLCPLQCQSAMESVSQILSNAVICPKTSNETALALRSKLVDVMKLYCLSSSKTIKRLGLQDSCYKGVRLELSNAGKSFLGKEI